MGQAKLFGHCLFDDRALEEVRVVARMQKCGVGERELAEILCGDEVLLHHLECLRNNFLEIGHIEMGEVRTEDRS